MFRTIRRKNREISVEAMNKLLKESRRAVLAVNGDDHYPYALPINYYYDQEEKRIYFHGTKVGYKAEAINNCDKVCFTVFGNETIKDVEWAPYMQSVVVFGRCHVMEGNDAEMKLRQFAMKYYPDIETVNDVIKRAGNAVQMYVIEIEHMTGKEVQES